MSGTLPDLPPADEFSAALLDWFAAAMRPLPWRRDYAPYSVWVSEIMLQQTQMERGVRHFNAWMRRFPDIRSVAMADEKEILRAWEGLGYYSRARNLHAAAREIMRRHGGVFPRDADAIRALPGVGDYTAAAIASIAFNLPEPAADANVLRIFSRLCDIALPVAGKSVRAFVDGAVRALTPPGSARLFCQALMELGALVCGRTPRCGDCPVGRFCLARRNGTVGERPVKAAKPALRLIESAAGIVMADGRVFLSRRPPDGLWGGLWEFPSCEVPAGDAPDEALLRHLADIGLPATVEEKLPVVRHGYTTNRVTLHGFLCRAAGGVSAPRLAGETAWAATDELSGYAFPAGHRKLLEQLGWKG